MDRILIIMKKNGLRASSAPLLGLFSIIFKHVYWYIQQISGERLQDHWSSGFYFCSKQIVGRRQNLLAEAVLTCTHNLCFEQIYIKYIKIF